LVSNSKARIACPRCEQDYIAHIRIKATGTELFLCPECDATWFAIEDIGVKPFFDYGTYVKGLGLSVLWNELEVISEVVWALDLR
jgi:hypothetical protein